MSILIVNTGTSANKGDGDSLRTAFNKINANFSYLNGLVATDGGGTTGTVIANTGDITFTDNIISSKNANEDIVLNPNGVGRVRLVNTLIQFDNGTGGKSAVQILNTKLGGSPTGLATDFDNASLRIIGDKEDLGTLVDMGLYDGPLSTWRSKVLVDWEGNLSSQASITARTTLNSLGEIHANGNIQADGDVIGSYVIANYGFKFADGTTQLTAVSTTTATPTRLGGIKVGNNLSVTEDGTLSAIVTGTISTTATLGVVQIGSGLQITPEGVISVQGSSGGADVVTTATIATTSSLGIIQVGSGLSITLDGILSITGESGLGHILVNDTTVYPDNLSKAITLANKDINGGTSGASYITIPATDDIGDMRLLSHGVMLITTEPDLSNGIVIAPGIDGFGPGYVAVGASGTTSTAGLFLFSANAQIDLWPNNDISYLNSGGDPNVGSLDMFTYNLGYISLRPDSTATVIVTGGGVDIRSGGLKFPDGSYMNTAAATGVTSFNNSAGEITFTGSNIISQLGYTPYNGATNSSGFLTSAVLTFNGASGTVTFTSSNIISELGYTPYDSANPAGYISGNSVVGSFNGSTGTVTFTASDIISQLGYTPYNGTTNSNNFLTTASLISVSGNINPSKDTEFDLGSSSTQWRSLYLSSSTLYIGGTAVSVNGAGNLLVDGANVSTSGYDQSLNTTDSVLFDKVQTAAVTFSDGSTQTTAVSQVPAAESTQTGIVYALTSSTSTAPVALGYNALRNDVSLGYNTAMGNNALCANTLGSSNSAFGYRALWRNTTGGDNVAVGMNALTSNKTGDGNTAVGSGSMTANTYGAFNSALGWGALFWNKTGYGNTAVGASALYFNCGDYNVAVGCMALQQNTLGYGNVALGSATLKSNILGSTNIAIGNEALFYNTTGNSNIAVGPNTLMSNTYGQYNVALGYQAMCFNATGDNNIAIGNLALRCNTEGGLNVAIGNEAMACVTAPGCSNVAIGDRAMGYGCGGGAANVAIGFGPLGNNTIGDNNIGIGEGALLNNTSGSNNIALGYTALKCNTVGICNVAIGPEALACNTLGRSNIALGNKALFTNTSGWNNVAVGQCALTSNVTGCSNIAVGFSALKCNTVGRWNVAIGECSLFCNISGYQNVAVGLLTLTKNTTGYNNTALGFNTLCSNTLGDSNVALGWGNMTLNTTGNCNTVVGQASLSANTFGGSNIAIGRCALVGNTTGSHNIGFGCGSLAGSTVGDNNIAIGQNSGCSITAGSNNVIIGSNTGTIFAGGNNNVLLSDGSGNIKALFTTTGAVSFGNTANFGTTGYVLQSNGPTSPPSWINAGTLTSGVATTATNLQNGTTGQIPYQLTTSSTAFFGPGTAGQILVSAGATAPTYTNTATIQVGYATNVLGGDVGQVLYQSTSGATAFLALGTAGQILTAGATAPTYVATATFRVGYAINIIGGTTGQLHYQSAGNTTGFVGAGTSRQLLQSNGAAAPTYVNTSTLQVGYATNILGGTAGQLHYQSASGITAFIGTNTTGTILVSGGTGAPVYQNTLTLAGILVATSTQTGALRVAGGVGIGGALYVGGNIDTQQIALNSSASSTTTNTANALYVAGGAWIGGTSYIRGSAIFDGTVVFNSSTVYTVNQSVSTSSNFLQIHSPTTASWTFNDGKDIGVVFNYYGSGDANAFLGRKSDTGYLEWYETGTDGASAFTGTYGTFKTGNIQLVSNVANLGNTNTGALTVTGGVGISGGLYVGGTITGALTGTASAATNLSAGGIGSLPYQSAVGTTSYLSLGASGYILTAGASAPQWAAIAGVSVGSATTSSNISGGTAGQIPYQLTTSSTVFFGPGTAGQLLMSAGANTPAYTDTSSIFVGFASNIIGGATGSIQYQSNTSTTEFLSLGTLGKVLTAGASGPTWTDIATVTAGASTTATNLANGGPGQVVYQSSIGTTAFVSTGTSGSILVSAGTSAPTFTSSSTVQVGYASNLLGGTAGSLHYQSGSGATAFAGGGAVGQLLVSGGTGAPAYTSTASIQVGAATNVLGGAKGGIPYQSSTSTTAFLAIGNQGQVLTVSAIPNGPVWTDTSSLTAGNATTATNLAGGTVGQIPYQSAAGVTSFFGAGTAGQIMVSQGAGTPFFINTATFWVGNANTAIHIANTQTGALLYQTGTNQTGVVPLGTSTSILVAGVTAPQWVPANTISIGSASLATNIAGGVSGQLHYQSAPGTTGFVSTGTSGQVLVSAGPSVPLYTSSLSGLTLSNTTINGYVAHDQTAISVGTSAVTVDTFSTSTYRSAKYVISIGNSGTGEYQTTEALVVHNGTSAFIKSDSVFSGLYSLMSFAVSISTGNVILQGTGASASNLVKVQKVYITV